MPRHAAAAALLAFLGASASTSAAVVLGNQVLRDAGFAALRGERVAVLTNPTGVFQDTLEGVVDVMAADEALDVVCVFSPEHGFRGNLQAETGDPIVYHDDQTGLPVVSAYKLDPSQLAAVVTDLNITSVVVDVQDVGVRLYTFVWTMYTTLEALTMADEPATRNLVVLDRPNPLGGLEISGPMLNLSCCASGYGRVDIPFTHGMTIGELALLFNSKLNTPLPPANVQVVRMVGWGRGMAWVDTGLAWIPPSPNVPTPATASAYASTVFLEATTAAEGRGTTIPFLLFGAPFVSAPALARTLNARTSTTTASAFREAYFEPTFSKYNGTVVNGCQWLVERTLRGGTNSTGAFLLVAVRVLGAFRDLASPPSAFAWDGSWFGHPGTELVDSYAGTPQLREMIDARVSAEAIVAHFSPAAEQFRAQRAPFLLYE